MRLRAVGPRWAAIALVAGLGVATTVASGAPTALVAVNTVQNAALGKILVSAKGRTLYHPSSERRNAVRCTGACAVTWPPLVVGAGAKPIAGPGVKASLLGTVKRPDGKLQVTYAGLALYLYSGDRKAGDVKGQGSGGAWHAVAPSGAVVTKAVTSAPGSAGGATSGGGSSSGAGSSSGSGSTPGSGSTGGGSAGGGSTGGTTTDCAQNPGGYGCM
ncbi:MAG TPA: hypothetical protein VFB42_14685 [Gaiellaceae bacterium]|nr:hypothetical protein [Gaiellaceae bacterium]